MIFGLFGALAATSRSAGGALYTLYKHDDQLAALDPRSSAAFRTPSRNACASPATAILPSRGSPPAIPRSAARAIGKGMIVRPSPLAANYDPDVFPDPLRFDIHRKPKRIMSFAVGPHHCVGNILGRTTITVAIRRLLARFPDARSSILTSCRSTAGRSASCACKACR